MHNDSPQDQTIMDMDMFQDMAAASVIYPRGIAHKEGQPEAPGSVHVDLGILYTALGLAGEAGEYANKAKKAIRDHNSLTLEDLDAREALAHELGDLLWYVAMAAYELGYSLETVAHMNLHKLNKRAEAGVLAGSGDHR